MLEQRKISEILVYSTDCDNEEYAAVRHLKTSGMVERAKVRKDGWHHKTARESRQVREPSQHFFLPLNFSHQECENLYGRQGPNLSIIDLVSLALRLTALVTLRDLCNVLESTYSESKLRSDNCSNPSSFDNRPENGS